MSVNIAPVAFNLMAYSNEQGFFFLTQEVQYQTIVSWNGEVY